MRMLAAPVKGDLSVTSGESGAVGMGVISSIMNRRCLQRTQRSIGVR